MTLLQAMMEHNHLGFSYNSRAIQAGVVKLNGINVAPTTTTSVIVGPGDVICIGKRDVFIVDSTSEGRDSD